MIVHEVIFCVQENRRTHICRETSEMRAGIAAGAHIWRGDLARFKEYLNEAINRAARKQESGSLSIAQCSNFVTASCRLEIRGRRPQPPPVCAYLVGVPDGGSVYCRVWSASWQRHWLSSRAQRRQGKGHKSGHSTMVSFILSCCRRSGGCLGAVGWLEKGWNRLDGWSGNWMHSRGRLAL